MKVIKVIKKKCGEKKKVGTQPWGIPLLRREPKRKENKENRETEVGETFNVSDIVKCQWQSGWRSREKPCTL